jgi:ribosomal protein S18 acetylase RimI-like enzyme
VSFLTFHQKTIFRYVKKLCSHKYSLFWGYIPRRMSDCNIRLRPFRILDSHFINTSLINADVVKTSDSREPSLRSWVTFWLRMRRTYASLHCVEVNSKCIGFIGLYNLNPDKSAEMTLIIFDAKDRHLNYGSRAFDIVTRYLKRYFSRIIVRVRTANHASIAFWTKMGFRELYTLKDIKVMSLHLRKSIDERDFRCSQ